MFKSRLLTLLFTIFSFYGFSQPARRATRSFSGGMTRGSGGFDDGVVVGGPIDNHLILLFFVAMVLGAWYIYKVKQQRVSE